ncbi:MAG TPA: NUDIX hydrolase [Smithellaceae bacterium]|nr:NUDIX hydrolase [Smithellaceae bacterium]HRS89494.1 NUDIX hydrolase [Smithellaceae bacterium]HRV26443.1 NUDIX hydrolase [Smithellaceae bacterium]
MEKNNPTRVYRCKIFDVYEEDVPLPNGKSIRQTWIDHKPTVAIIPINDKNEILLVKQYRIAVRKHLLEIPAGAFDHHEEPAEVCAQRELAEETGFRAAKMTKLYEGYLLAGYCNEYMHFFLASDLAYAPLKPDEDEFIEVVPTELSRAAEMFKKGEITDTKTALGIMLTLNYFKAAGNSP